MGKATVFVLTILLGAGLTGTAFADDVVDYTMGYIQINNGDIVTNEGQSFQVVSQFGNRGDQVLRNVAVICSWDSRLGEVGNVYAGPFMTTVKQINAVAGGATINGFVIDDVDLIPGQNCNFSFDVLVEAQRNFVTYLQCWLVSARYVPGQGNPIDHAQVTVTVQ